MTTFFVTSTCQDFSTRDFLLIAKVDSCLFSHYSYYILQRDFKSLLRPSKKKQSEINLHLHRFPT